MASRSQGFFVGKVMGKLDFLHCFGAALIFSFIFCSLILAEPLVNTLPTGYQSVSGNIEFNQTANTLNVSTGANNSIANYQSFNVGRNATVNFNLPSSQSAILNRVTGGIGSEIFGSINSNGKVFLVNPSGILFGSTAQVNVGSLVTSTLNINNQDFLNKNYNFTQNGNTPAGIVNNGSLIAEDGSVVLLGGAIQNTGNIQASNGSIQMAVGKSATITMEDGVNVDIEINEALEDKVNGVQTAIINSGSLSANVIKAQASLNGAIYDQAINNSGLIEATSFNNQNGVIELIGQSTDKTANVINTGNLIANNEAGKGGTIKVLGDNIGILSGKIEASGKTGGGEILIGGDYQGNNKSIYNAQNTFIGSQSQIKADAIENGNGGKIIIWADNATNFYGHLSVKGGLNGGNGGFAEISGKNTLISKGKYDLSASSPFGEFGTLLFDPLNIQIVGGSSDGSDQGNILSTQLQNNPGSNVLGAIFETEEGDGTPNPFIIYESEIESTNASIILRARNGITTSGTFGSGEVLLQNNRSLNMETQNLAVDGNSGINLTGSTHGNSLLFRTQGYGSITLRTGTGGISSSAGINASNLQTASRSITLRTNGGNIDLNNNINAGSGASLTLSSAGGTINGANAGITAGTLTISSGLGSVDLTNAANNIDTLIPNSTGGNISYREADGQNFSLGTSVFAGFPSTLSGGGDLSLQVGGAGNITQTGNLTADILSLTLGSSGSSFLALPGNNINMLNASSTGSSLSYQELSNNSFTLNNINFTNGGDLSLYLVGTGTFNALSSINADELLVSIASGAVNISNANINTFRADSTSGLVTFNANPNQSFNLGASNLSGGADLTLNLSGSGVVNQTGALIADIFTINAGSSGNNIFTNAANNINTLIANSTGGNISYTDSNNIILDSVNFGTGTLNLSALGTGNIIAPNLITGNVLNLTTVSGNATQDGNSTGIAINTNINNFAGNTTSGTIKVNNNGSLNLNTSAINTGSLLVSNSSGNITIDDNITATSGQLNFNGNQAGSLTLNTTNFGNIIQTSGFIFGGTLNLNFGNNDVNITNADFTTLTASSTGGSLNYLDTDGFTIGNFNLNTGDLMATAFAPNLTASNSFTESNMTLSGNLINLDSVNLIANGISNISQSSSINAENINVIVGSGNADLTNINNNTVNFSANSSAGGNINYTDADSFNVTAANIGSGNLSLITNGAGNITQTDAITADILSLTLGSSGSAFFINTGNNINTLIANSTGGNISYREANGQNFALGASTLSGGGDLSLQVGTLEVGTKAHITQTGALIADSLNLSSARGTLTLTNTSNDINNLSVSAAQYSTVSYTDSNNIVLDSVNFESGTLNLSALGTGNIIAPNLITGNVLNLTTVSGNATQDGNSTGIAINTNINYFAGNTTSGTIKVNNNRSLNLKTSAINTGSLLVSNSKSNITIYDNITATSGQLNFNAFQDLIIDKLGNLNFNTFTTGFMNLTAGRDILIGSNDTSGNLNVDAGFQTINAGRDLILTGRGAGGTSGYSRLQGTGIGIAQNISTGRDLIIQMSNNLTGDNNFGAISTTSTAGNQILNIGGNLKVIGGIDNNTASTSSAILSSTAEQNITVSGNIDIQGGTGNNNTAIISAVGIQNITSTNGNINVQGGSGAGSLGRISTTANSIALPSTINANNGSINIGNNAGILATSNAGTLILNSGNSGITLNNGIIQGGSGNQAGSLTLNTTNFGNIIQTSGFIFGGTLNLNFGNNDVNITNADFTTLTASSTGGSLNYLDTDGFTIGNFNLNTGDLMATAFAPNLTASNSFTESNMTLSGNLINLDSVNLIANGISNITQSAGSSLLANDLILSINSGDASLLQTTNDINNITLAINSVGGSFQLADLDNVNVISIIGESNIISGDTLGITANTDITGLSAFSTSGGNLLFRADNDFDGIGSINNGNLTGLSLSVVNGNITLQSAGLSLSNSITTTGSVNLTATDNSNISQSSSINAENINVIVGSGNADLTNINNNTVNFSANSSAGGNINYTDADSFNVTAANIGSGNLSLITNGAGNITQTGDLTGNTLSISTNSGNANLDNTDFINLSINSSSGNILYNDKDGIILNTSNLGSGQLTVNSFAGAGLTADNSVLENNTDILGNIQAANINLNVNSGNLNLNTSSLQANNNLIINVSNGNIIANTYTAFPQLSSPNLQITASGLIGGANSPLGINKLILSSISYINEVGGLGLFDYETLLGLMTDSSNNFLLYPLFTPHNAVLVGLNTFFATPITGINGLSFETERRIGNTLMNINTSEETYRFEEMKCSEMFGGGAGLVINVSSMKRKSENAD